MDDDALSATMKMWIENTHAGRSNGENTDDINVADATGDSNGDCNNGEDNSSATTNDDKACDTAFDTGDFLKGLNAIFDNHEGATKAEPYLLQAMTDAENAGDDAGLLTVLNEAMGFYRSQSRHDDNQWIVQRTLELALRMRLEGTEAWTTTLINCATSMRAAGQYDQAQDLYRQAIDSARTTLEPTDRRMAALHNNLSMLYSETGHADDAERELRSALQILEEASTDATRDIDIAATHTNLALILLDRINALASDQSSDCSSVHSSVSSRDASATAPKNTSQEDIADNAYADTSDPNVGNSNAGNPRTNLIHQLMDDALQHAALSLNIYRNAGQEHAGHYASALAGYAQVCLAAGHASESVDYYRQSLTVIENNYGRDNDYYRITATNLVHAEQAAEHAHSKTNKHISAEKQSAKETSAKEIPYTTVSPQQQPSNSASHTPESPENTSLLPSNGHVPPSISGLQLAQAYWNKYGQPLIEEHYPEYRGRIAAGLVGHGSECYGFDDDISHDHDFGPGFCLWLTDEDYTAIGKQLQADYDALPQTFMGYGPRESTPRAQGDNRRVGVFSIGDFFESITGYRQAPSEDKPYEWLMLDEATLAAATNGKVFADPLGAFSKTRQGFALMPDDVRLSLISRRLGMISQAGQYNLPRMLTRGDGAAAWCSINEFVEATASLIFLVNQPVTVGYLPYYKWRFAALRALSRRMGMRLTDVCEQLETILRLSSAACFGGAGFVEGSKGAGPAIEHITTIVESICSEIVTVLTAEGLTTSDETFLEWQRPYVEAHIERRDSCLISV